MFIDSSAAPRRPGGPESRRVAVAAALSVGIVAGALVGGPWGLGATRDSPSPDAIPVTRDTFPQVLLGETRDDSGPRNGSSNAAADRLDAAFERQLVAYRFSHGGDGATLRYGGRLSLTIVNGVLTPSVPRLGSIGSNWRINDPRRVVSLRSSDVRCVFEPEASPDGITAIGDLGGLESDGRTECVLLDAERHLSLRIEEVGASRGAGAVATAHSFRDELQRIHADLVK
ncbi:MAG: hypothetical protein ABIS84_00185 [Arachnia sp.]